jgi:hypothetical protein
MEGPEGVWDLKPLARGVEIEEALGQNLPANFPVIDRFANGVATSIKRPWATPNASAMERIQRSVSRAEVEATRNLYKEAAAAGRGGNFAPQRAAYMEDILKLWR